MMRKLSRIVLEKVYIDYSYLNSKIINFQEEIRKMHIPLQSLYKSNLPEAPPCPASILQYISRGSLLVLLSLSFAIHFAGSKYCT